MAYEPLSVMTRNHIHTGNIVQCVYLTQLAPKILNTSQNLESEKQTQGLLRYNSVHQRAPKPYTYFMLRISKLKKVKNAVEARYHTTGKVAFLILYQFTDRPLLPDTTLGDKETLKEFIV